MKLNLLTALICLSAFMGAGCAGPGALDSASQKSSLVTVKGVGINAEEALLSAFRNAVQQVVGVIVDAETLIKNEKVVKDEILDFSNGFVEKFEKIKEGRNDDGLYEVTIWATVKHRQLIEKLKQAKVVSFKVDGQSLFGATTSRMETAGRGAALLKKGLEDLGLPESLVTARVINQKPKVLAENDDAILSEWIIRIGYDREKYFGKVVPRLKQLLGEVATSQIRGPLTKRDSWFHYSSEKIAAIHSWQGWQSDDRGNAPGFWSGISHKTYKGTPVYLMEASSSGGLILGGKSEFQCYYLDQKSAKVLKTYCSDYWKPSPKESKRVSQIVHLELKNASGETIFSEEFRLGIRDLGSSGKPTLLRVPQPGGNRGLKSSVDHFRLFFDARSPYVDDDSFVGPNGRRDLSIPRSVVIMPLVFMYGPFKNCYLSDGVLFHWKPQVPLDIIQNVTQLTCRVVRKETSYVRRR